MDPGIYVATSGFLTQQRRLEVIANNLANASTVGYKADVPVFRTSGLSPTSVAPEQRPGLWEPIFVGLSESATFLSQGPLKRTENPLDLALSGKGFFVIETPQGRRYSRKGDFTLDAGGRLTTQDGYPVIGQGGPIALPEGEVRIDREGNIAVNGNQEGRLRIVAPAGPGRMVKEGKVRFAWSGAPGDLVELARPEVMQGYLEMSNVDPVHQMVQMIDAIRTYEAQQKVIHAFDGAERKAINEVGRLR